MYLIIQEDILLLFGTFLAIFAFSLGLYDNPFIAGISNRKLPISMFAVLYHPYAALTLAYKYKRKHFLMWLELFTIIILVLSFLFLNLKYSIYYALLGFIPMAAFVILAIHYTIWISSFVITRVIDVGNIKFNVLFALTIFELLIIYTEFLTNRAYPIDISTFILAMLNLIVCYIMTCTAMRMVLRQTTMKQETSFTHHNLWKVALLMIVEFIVELTFFCYLASTYFLDAYSTSVTLFDMFYYVVMTFGTVGYGDIIPTCIFTKLMAIIIALTSIACIGIMLSSFLSVRSQND